MHLWGPPMEVSGRALSVGWLSVHHPFETGDFPTELLDRLATVARTPVNLLRGLHDCDICSPALRIGSLWITEGLRGNRVRVAGHDIEVGNGEIQLMGEGDTVYVAPTMIFHYIVDHRYLPPEEFIEAVRVGRVPDFPPEAFQL
jgi:hypothetical protein